MRMKVSTIKRRNKLRRDLLYMNKDSSSHPLRVSTFGACRTNKTNNLRRKIWGTEAIKWVMIQSSSHLHKKSPKGQQILNLISVHLMKTSLLLTSNSNNSPRLSILINTNRINLKLRLWDQVGKLSTRANNSSMLTSHIKPCKKR